MGDRAALLLFPLALGESCASAAEEDVLLRALIPCASPDAASHSSSTFSETLDQHTRTSHASDHNLELCSLLQYASASCLSELAHNALLSSSTRDDGEGQSGDAYLVTAAEERQCFCYPVESGRYVLAATLPRRLLTLLDASSVIAFVLATALRGYAVTVDAAARPEQPLYRPLHARLNDAAEQVQRGMHVQLRRLVDLVMAPHAQRAATLQRMAHTRVSRMRTGDALYRAVHRAVCAAVTPVRYAGRLTRHDVAADVRRFVCAAHAVWADGIPIHTSTPDARLLAEYLLPVAMSAVMQESSSSGVVECVAMVSPWRNEETVCGRVGGYIEVVSKDAGCTETGVVTVAVCGAHGWTVAAVLRPVTVAFAPGAMSLVHLVRRLQGLVCDPTELEMVRREKGQATIGTRRTLALLSPATTGVMAVVTQLWVWRRAVGHVPVTRLRESCLLKIVRIGATVTIDPAHTPSAVRWDDKWYGTRLAPLLRYSTQLAPSRSASTVFAILRRQPQESSVVIRAMPVVEVTGVRSVVYVVAELQSGAAASGELAGFTTWLLARML